MTPLEQAWSLLKSDPRMQAYSQYRDYDTHPDLAEAHGLQRPVSNLGTIDPNAYSMALRKPQNIAGVSPFPTQDSRERMRTMQRLMDPSENSGRERSFMGGPVNLRSLPYRGRPVSMPEYNAEDRIQEAPTYLEGGFVNPHQDKDELSQPMGISRQPRPSYPIRVSAGRNTPQGRINQFTRDEGRDPTDEELRRLYPPSPFSDLGYLP